ncbi:MAG: hypothetical protein Q9174_004264 [Haloplaca sp. 1 TL-2023]
MDDRFHNFGKWFQQNNGHFGESVELAYKPDRGLHLCTRPGIELPSDGCIVSCPRSLTLSSFNASHGKDAFVERFKHGVQNDLPSISEISLLRFFLLEQFQLGASSFWSPYINILPDPYSDFPFNTPLYYDDEDLKWIRGTSLEHSLRRTEAMWREEHSQGIQMLLQDHEGRYPCAPFKTGASQEAAPVLLPGLDLLNHSPSAKVTWKWTEDACSIISHVALPGGAEILNNYAPKSNEEPMGSMAVARVTALCKQRIQCTASAGQAAEDGLLTRPITGVGWIRLVSNGFQHDETHVNEQTHCFSPAFLAHASMAFFNASETCGGYSETDTELFTSDMTRGKLHTACAIAMILQKQYTDILAGNANLPQWPKNLRQFHAARYRRGQILILHTIIKAIITKLRAFVGLEQPWLRDKRVVRLDHILRAGPKDFLQEFRSVLHLGLGTRNVQRIRQQNSLDTAFTLWFCGLWLWTYSHEQEENRRRTTLPSRTAKWLSFVCTTYGEESDIGRQWDKLSTSEEGKLLASNCQGIVRAAVEKNPQSFYNSPEATFSRMLWCYRVILEESFMCPDLDGHSGEDENDEIMLFLKDGS